MADQERNYHAIGSAFRASVPEGDSYVTDRTWHDLSMDDVFARLDRCVTGAGQQMLYRRLRTPRFEETELARFDQRVRAFGDDALRQRFAKAMKPLAQKSMLDLAPMLYGKPPAVPKGAWF